MEDDILCGLCRQTFPSIKERAEHDCKPVVEEPVVEETTAEEPQEATVTVVGTVEPAFSVTKVAPPTTNDRIGIVDANGNGAITGTVNYIIPADSDIAGPIEDELDRALASKGMQHQDTWSDYGQYLFNHILNKCPHNPTIAAVGHAGMGKTRFFQALARAKGMDFVSVNAHQGMDISWLVGMPVPTNTTNGVGLIFGDGDLTAAIRSTGNPNGTMFVLEEFNRAPPEFMTRLHGLTDQSAPRWTLPEAAGIGDTYVSIHPKFQFVASMNPSGGEYQTAAVDPAMGERLTVTLPVNEPLADEIAIIKSYFPDETVTYNSDKKTNVTVAKQTWISVWERFIEDARPPIVPRPTGTEETANLMPPLPHQVYRNFANGSTRMLSTRTLLDMVLHIQLGWTPTEVAVMVLANRYEDSAGIAQKFLALFGSGVKATASNV